MKYIILPNSSGRSGGKIPGVVSEKGKYENVLYPGIPELLRDLKAAGAHLAVASSKPTVFVEDILNYFGIRQYFEIVVGSELDGRRDRKEEVVRKCSGSSRRKALRIRPAW